MLTTRLNLFIANLRLKLQKFNCVLAEYLEQSGVLKILELCRIMNYLTTFHVLSFLLTTKLTLISHILTSPSCALANKFKFLRFHFTCDEPATVVNVVTGFLLDLKGRNHQEKPVPTDVDLPHSKI